MLVGLISDVHGNSTALLSTLQWLESKGAELFVCAGDLVGYSSDALEVLEIIVNRGVVCVMGNHDDSLVHPECWSQLGATYRDSIALASHTLPEAMRTYVTKLPIRLNVDCAGKTLHLVHGSPEAPLTGRVQPESFCCDSIGEKFDALAVGHTHRQFVKFCARKWIANPGSCGLSRDGDPRAGCILWNTIANDVRPVRVLYNPTRTIHNNIRAKLPLRVNEQLIFGKSAPHYIDWSRDFSRELSQILEQTQGQRIITPWAAWIEMNGFVATLSIESRERTLLHVQTVPGNRVCQAPIPKCDWSAARIADVLTPVAASERKQ